ncbi:MAG: hypothetical protein JKY95_13500 [Planctomycetaceae bacterium]|nr:hypothetical protein [Planctomycetaceae bacterium]
MARCTIIRFQDHQGYAIDKNGLEAVWRIDYSWSVVDSPTHRGFDHFWGTVSCPSTNGHSAKEPQFSRQASQRKTREAIFLLHSLQAVHRK